MLSLQHWWLASCICVATMISLHCPSALATRITAHRGDSSRAPENTLASIQSAIGIADLTEMDVRITRGGELVLMHDAGINRTTDGRGPIRRKTLAELHPLDAGSWFSNEFIGEAIPTLDQAVTFSIDSGIEPIIERKAGDAVDYHRAFLDLGLEESQFRVISFNRRFLRELNVLNPDYQLGLLAGGAITQGRINRLKSDGIDFLNWRHTSVRNQRVVDLVHANGMELHVWTVNNENRMQQLINLGVDGITTDKPLLLNGLMNPSQLAASFAPIHTSVTTVPEPAMPQAWLLLLLVACSRLRDGRTKAATAIAAQIRE